jgi:hypothetical protein
VELLRRGDSFVFQAPRRHEHAGFERAYRAVVRLDGLREAAADVLEMLGQLRDAVVERTAQFADLLRVLRDRVLLPAVGDRLEQRNERQRARQHDALVHAEFQQPLVVLHRGRQQGLPRHEHDDDVGGGLEVGPVALVPQAVDVILDLAGVVLQLAVTKRVLLALHRVEVGRQRHLGVHDDVLAARQLHDHVRGQPAPFRLGRLFEIEVQPFDEAGALEHATELQFAPLAPDVRRPQRPHEAARLGMQHLLRVAE